MGCPSEEDLASYASGRGDDAVARHVASCRACAEIAAIVQQTVFEDPQPADTEHHDRRDPVPGDTVGRYVILRNLGQGGMGVVVLAYDPVLDRAVALKLMRVDRASAALSARLEREARSLAQISHPNVVRVFDAGTWAGRVFLAMEHVEGETLRGWLAAAPRTSAEIVRLFVDVTRGLAATHAAGFVHRDIKPDNILVGADGVPRLADFGLVGWEAAGDRDGDGAVTPPPSSSDDLALTHTNTLVGTPGYMAPEQRAGHDVGPAADQFALCATLWEALFGVRPFADAASSALVEPPADRDVPAWLREVAARGLRPAPADRWPSAAALLVALQSDPIAARRRRLARAGAVAAFVALAALAVFGLTRRPTVADTRCTAMGDKLAGVWNAERAAQVRAALEATGRPYAAATFQRVAQRLDAYTTEWVSTRVDVCEATHARGEQSEALLDLRMACLDRRLGEVDALVTALSTGADGDVVDHAVQAAAKLSPLAACADLDALRAIQPMPEDPEMRAAVQALFRELDAARALEQTGRYREGLAIAAAAAGDAERLGYAPALAEALGRRGTLEEKSGDAKAAEVTLERAILIAADARDDALVAQIWADLLYTVAAPLARPDDALALRPSAEAAMRRAGGDSELEATLWTNVAIALYMQGNYAEARQYQARALAILERVLGPDHPTIARPLTSLGIMAYAQGEYDEARRYHARALASFERALGPEHPHTAAALTNLGLVAYAQGDYAEASRNHGSALAIWERALGPEHPHVASALTNLGLARLARGDYAEALRDHERALALREQVLGPDHPDVAISLNNRGSVYQAQGDYAAARRDHERALAIRERAFGPGHPEVAVSLNNLGDALYAQGSYDESRAYYERALAIWEQTLGADHPHLAYALTGLARSLLPLRHTADARSAAERAVRIREAGDVPAAELASSRFVLARALWAAGGAGARARAIDLARQADAGLRDAGVAADAERAEVEAWLRAHGGKPR